MSNTSTAKKTFSSEKNDPELRHKDDVPRMIIDDGQNIIFCNQAMQDICGNIENTKFTDIFSFDTELNEGVNNLTLKKSKGIFSFQINRIHDKNGKNFMVASTESTARSEDLIQYVDEKINDTQSFNSAPFLDLSFDACSITDNEWNFITVNQNFSDILGYSLEDLKDTNLLDIIHPDDRQKFESNISILYQNSAEQHSTIETYCFDKSGETRWIEWNHKYINEQLYSTGRDLTPLKSYRDSLQRQQQKLTEAEAIGHIGQWEWPVGGEEIEFSEQLYSIFGVEKGKFSPTLQNITRMIDRRDSGRMMQIFQRAIIEQNDYDMDFRLMHPDGNTRYIRCEGRCELDKEDDVIALYGIMQDITQTTQREKDLVKAKESVERAYAAKTQFLANMSHELRTPLNAIIGFSEMIERQLLGPIGTEKYLEYISGIRESGEHLLDLISDILDMSKIEAGKYELNVGMFNISKVIRMAAHMMEGRAVDAEIKINLDVQDDDLQIIADRRAVMQMVLNLLSNAVKFSHKKGVINLTLSKEDKHTKIVIKDDGIGIPANKLVNITMPFEQAESDYTREYEGSGLGLAITKELAEIHGGSLSIESTIDVGTKVTICLPYEVKK